MTKYEDGAAERKERLQIELEESRAVLSILKDKLYVTLKLHVFK